MSRATPSVLQRSPGIIVGLLIWAALIARGRAEVTVDEGATVFAEAPSSAFAATLTHHGTRSELQLYRVINSRRELLYQRWIDTPRSRALAVTNCGQAAILPQGNPLRNGDRILLFSPDGPVLDAPLSRLLPRSERAEARRGPWKYSWRHMNESSVGRGCGLRLTLPSGHGILLDASTGKVRRISELLPDLTAVLLGQERLPVAIEYESTIMNSDGSLCVVEDETVACAPASTRQRLRFFVDHRWAATALQDGVRRKLLPLLKLRHRLRPAHYSREPDRALRLYLGDPSRPITYSVQESDLSETERLLWLDLLHDLGLEDARPIGR